MLLSHSMACIWIVAAHTSEGEITWITTKKFENYSLVQLYTTALYYTVATITTVGYGDISGTNLWERVIGCVLMLMGVIIFSISSGSITSIINYADESNKQFNYRKEQLNRLYKVHKVPNDLYLELMAAVTHNTSSEVEELKDFIDALPLLL